MGVHPYRPALVDNTVFISHGDVLVTIAQKQFGDGSTSSTSSREYDFDIFLFLTHHFQRVGKPCQGDDGSAMLIVMKNRDVTFLFELLFYFKTTR